MKIAPQLKDLYFHLGNKIAKNLGQGQIGMQALLQRLPAIFYRHKNLVRSNIAIVTRQ